MICINCLHAKTEVYNSRTRASKGEVWRRRRCQQCGFTFTTQETIDIATVYSVSSDKPSGPTAAFSTAKLILSLLQVLEYSSQPADDAFWLAQTIVQKIIKAHRPDKNLLASDIASLSLMTLQNYNAVAALAYASRHGLAARLPRPGRPRKQY
jgi:transcriptional regulator NrdR family protein